MQYCISENFQGGTPTEG